MDQSENEEMALDIRQIFYSLLDHIFILLVAGITLTFVAGLVSKMFLQPTYTSSVSLYIINRQDEESTTTLTDLQTGTQLSKDYQILIKSRLVMEQVISELNLDLTYEQLASKVTVNAPADTRIIEIIVNDNDAYTVKKLADEIAAISAERIVRVMEMKKVNVISEGNLPTHPSSPNILLNSLLGGVLGIFIASLVIILRLIFNDSIKNAEDIERYLGIATLSEIPIEDVLLKKKHKKKHLKTRKQHRNIFKVIIKFIHKLLKSMKALFKK